MKKIISAAAFLGMGSFAMAQQTQMPPMKDQQDRKEMMEKKRAEHLARMEKDLNLTKAQVSEIKSIQDKHQAQREQQRIQNQGLRKQKMEEFKKHKQEMEGEMRKILTPEQYEKWQEKMMNKRQKMLETGKDQKWGREMRKSGVQSDDKLKNN